jgi:glycerol uptake facilitator-like aquaporin
MQNRLGAALVAEAVGTFLFFFVGAGSVALTAMEAGGPGLVGVALAHGLVLAVLVSAFGAVSGGHFNPAVTVAVRLAGRIEWSHAVMYVIAQLVGAVGAGLALRLVLPEPLAGPTLLGTPALGPGIGVMEGILIEAILTLGLIQARRHGHRTGGRGRRPDGRPADRRRHEPGPMVRPGRGGRGV